MNNVQCIFHADMQYPLYIANISRFGMFETSWQHQDSTPVFVPMMGFEYLFFFLIRALLTAETNFIVVPTRILLLSRTPVNLALGNNLILCSLIVLCQFSVLYFCWIPVDKNYLLVVLFCYQPLYYFVPFGNLEWACKRKWMTKGFYSNANMLKLLPFLVI